MTELIYSEVRHLKALLAETDYIACKLAEAATDAERMTIRAEYAVVLANRQAWRDRINELES